MEKNRIVETLPEALSFQPAVTADQFHAFKEEFLSHKKRIQEEVAVLKTAEKLREEFNKERRWWIGVTIALVALAAGSISRLF